MKAISVSEFGGPEVLKLKDMPDPRPPQSGEVLIRVNAAGVNPYDTYMRSGAYGSGNPALPFAPGSDARDRGIRRNRRRAETRRSCLYRRHDHRSLRGADVVYALPGSPIA
jgi:hypothetical protein